MYSFISNLDLVRPGAATIDLKARGLLDLDATIDELSEKMDEGCGDNLITFKFPVPEPQAMVIFERKYQWKKDGLIYELSMVDEGCFMVAEYKLGKDGYIDDWSENFAIKLSVVLGYLKNLEGMLLNKECMLKSRGRVQKTNLDFLSKTIKLTKEALEQFCPMMPLESTCTSDIMFHHDTPGIYPLARLLYLIQNTACYANYDSETHDYFLDANYDVVKIGVEIPIKAFGRRAIKKMLRELEDLEDAEENPVDVVATLTNETIRGDVVELSLDDIKGLKTTNEDSIILWINPDMGEARALLTYLKIMLE